MTVTNRKYNQTLNGETIFAGTSITSIIETSITAAGFVAVTLDAPCKSIFITTRDAADFLISNVSAGTTYSTIPGSLAMDFTGESGQIVMYVKGTSSTTLEVLCLD